MLKQFFTRKINKQEEQTAMTKVEEILARFGELSDEEKEQVRKGTAKQEDTSEQIEKAEERIEEKGEDSQTESDRIDESVAMQERNEGDKNSQSAEKRVDEAMGEDKYLAHEEAIKELRAEIERLKTAQAEAVASPREVGESESKRLDEIKNRYLN